MGRKGKNTTFEQRQLVIYHQAKGKTEREIAELLLMPRSTIGNIIRRFKNEDRIDLKPMSGRKPRLNDQDKRWITRLIKKNPRLSGPKIASEVSIHCQKNVHPETIRRVLRTSGYNGRVARRKPFISDDNKLKRKTFAETYKHMDQTYWNNVLFVDESKFNIFGSDGRTMVWRKPNTELQKENLLPSVKHGGGSVMVWGCMAASGVGNLVFVETTMDQFEYLNILKNNLRESVQKLGIRDDFHFYQDNDPKHKALNVRLWLLYNCPHVIETPAQSPDLNPIEHLWEELERRIRKHSISNKTQLKAALVEEWNNISSNITKKLVNSMPNRLNSVLQSKGLPTKY